MTLRKIALLGQPILLRRAAAVADPTEPWVASLVLDMRETLAGARGLGLAAPQVHAGHRIILVQIPDDAGTVDRTAAPLALVNPQLQPLDDERDHAFEGCLSIPGLRGRVPRHRRIGLQAIDLHGRAIERETGGLLARILQHEVDHLDGRLYLHRLEDPGHLAFDSELAALLDQSSETTVAVPGAAAHEERRRDERA